MKRVLIANRGEIAVRIIRACRVRHIQTVAVYSTVDRDALHVRMADMAICIGPGEPQESYLNQARLISAAQVMGADAIHPGYGFLSENAEFAQRCIDNHLIFIGPTPETIALLGDKAAARTAMQNANIPVIPGSPRLTDVQKACQAASNIGYPVMLKAVAGGGGKGMRIINGEEEMKQVFSIASEEANAAFGNAEMYIEKLILKPRHIEIQVLADEHGHVLSLGERDCSLQQYHQKVIEEAPSSIDVESRVTLQQLARNVTKILGFRGVGTLKFLYCAPGQYYFMEMNTRIQVEHPVTELITGLDLVDAQLGVANQEPLLLQQSDVQLDGHAIECRVTALAPGRVSGLHLPGGNGIRVDTALYQGYMIPPNYDALIAKIIAYGPTRAIAIRKLQVAISETVIMGVPTNLDFVDQLIHNAKWLDNQFDIEFIDEVVKNRRSHHDTSNVQTSVSPRTISGTK